MKVYKIFTLLAVALTGLVSCEEYDQHVYYPAPEPKSEIGKMLVGNTNYVYSIYNDNSYKIHPAVEVTELSYLNNEGRSMRTFWFKVDLTNPEISLECVAPGGKMAVGGQAEPLSKMLSHVDKEGHKVIAGINTDFGGGAGPQGAYWMAGTAVKPNFIYLKDRPRCFVSITKDGTAHIGTEEEFPAYEASNKSKMSELFCGSPMLVVDGKKEIAVPNDLDAESHPRTAIGIMPDKTTVYLLVVDGRRYTYSNGMYLDILADCFLALGCEQALNLDGGGSSTFIVAKDGEFGDPGRMAVLNWPNDGGGIERDLHNGLAIVVKN